MAKKIKAPKMYLVIYHSPASAMKKMQTATPEQMAEGMKAWEAWGKKCGKALVDFGAPVMGGINLKGTDAAVPSKRKVSGYSVLQAETMGAVKKLMKGHPHLSWVKGCEIEVHEAMSMCK